MMESGKPITRAGFRPDRPPAGPVGAAASGRDTPTPVTLARGTGPLRGGERRAAQQWISSNGLNQFRSEGRLGGTRLGRLWGGSRGDRG
ncbi:hypothetical protein GCM10022205_04330 [Spinactinospora alkalitolerans]